MSGGYWRDRARPIIAAVIAEVGTDDEKKLRAALRAAYPFHERKMWPYKVWLDEIKVQTGKKRIPEKLDRRKTFEPAAGQQQLF